MKNLQELRIELNNILCSCQQEVCKLRDTFDADDNPEEQALARDTSLLLEEVIMFSRGTRSLRHMATNIFTD